MILTAIAAFWAGRLTAAPADTCTFYAVIERIDGPHLLVQGLDINDINHRGQFHFTIQDSTVLLGQNTAIASNDLQVGNRIAVTYTGPVQETYPAGLTCVTMLQLLKDTEQP